MSMLGELGHDEAVDIESSTNKARACAESAMAVVQKHVQAGRGGNKQVRMAISVQVGSDDLSRESVSVSRDWNCDTRLKRSVAIVPEQLHSPCAAPRHAPP